MNTTMNALLKLLDQSQFQSGQELADRLNISRTMVWKAIKQLQEQGVSIDVQKGQGYRLISHFEALDKDKILAGIDSNTKIELTVIEETTSTNDEIAKFTPEDPENILVCLAEQQTGGKGRQGRKWVSPYGANLYISFRFRYREALTSLYSLTPLLGLMCVSALEKQGITGLQLKWPNDILLAGKKLGGILVEIKGEFNSACDVIIGIGINVNMEKAEESISQPWTSLSQETKKHRDRNVLAAELISTVAEGIERFSPNQLAAKIEDWRRLDRYYGQQLRLNLGKEEISGISQGIDTNGALLIQLESGDVKAFNVGEIENTRHDN